MAQEPLLNANHLTKVYGSGHTEVRAVDDVSLAIGAGELVLVMGPSGSGKTTLLSMLGGLLRPTAGQVEIDGIDITALKEAQLPDVRALKVGFIFQAFNLLDALSVEENILFPAQLRPGGIRQARECPDRETWPWPSPERIAANPVRRRKTARGNRPCIDK
jgi:putative ABC transport system ATP-binding protein